MPIQFLDNTTVAGTLSSSSDILTSGRFLSGGQDVFNIINGFNNLNGNTAYTTLTANSANWNTAYRTLSVISYAYIPNLSSIQPNFGVNTVASQYSFVAGGSANYTSYTNTFILGTSLSASKANYTYVNNLSTQGNINTLTLSTSSLQVGSISASGNTGSAAPGTITAKMPIYNASGTFIGYIPIYNN